MYSCGAIGANGREEVGVLDAVYDIVQFLAVAREENPARSWSVAAADDIALDERGRIWSLVEGLVESLEAVGKVSSRMPVEACGMTVSISAPKRRLMLGDAYLAA